MRPISGDDGETVNWLNYKTGIKHIYFRMDVDKDRAGIAIELRHPDPEQRQRYYKRLGELKSLFRETVGEEWVWQFSVRDEDGKEVSRIGTNLENVNLFNMEDWPAIISFLKPRIIKLDSFWSMVKEGMEG